MTTQETQLLIDYRGLAKTLGATAILHQVIAANNDANGNPRRVVFAYNAEGRIVASGEIGYGNVSEILAEQGVEWPVEALMTIYTSDWKDVARTAEAHDSRATYAIVWDDGDLHSWAWSESTAKRIAAQWNRQSWTTHKLSVIKS